MGCEQEKYDSIDVIQCEQKFINVNNTLIKWPPDGAFPPVISWSSSPSDFVPLCQKDAICAETGYVVKMFLCEFPRHPQPHEVRTASRNWGNRSERSGDCIPNSAFRTQLCSAKSHADSFNPSTAFITLPSKPSSVQLNHTQTALVPALHFSVFKAQLCSAKSHTKSVNPSTAFLTLTSESSSVQISHTQTPTHPCTSN